MFFIEPRNKSIWFYTKFWVIQALFLTSCFWRLKPVQRNYGHFFFLDFKPKWALEGLMKLKLHLKMLLIEIIFEWKVIMNQKTKVKLSFRFMSGCLNPRPRKTYVYIFWALSCFCNFQTTSCFLKKLRTYTFDSTLSLFSSLYTYTSKDTHREKAP